MDGVEKTPNLDRVQEGGLKRQCLCHIRKVRPVLYSSVCQGYHKSEGRGGEAVCLENSGVDRKSRLRFRTWANPGNSPSMRKKPPATSQVINT